MRKRLEDRWLLTTTSIYEKQNRILMKLQTWLAYAVSLLQAQHIPRKRGLNFAITHHPHPSASADEHDEGDDVLVLRTAEVDLPRDAAVLAIVRGRSHRQLFSFMQNDLLYIMPHPAPQRDRTTIAMIMRGSRVVFGNGQHLARGRARSPGQRPYIWPEAVRPTPNRVIQGARANQGIKAATRAITRQILVGLLEAPAHSYPVRFAGHGGRSPLLAGTTSAFGSPL